MGVACTHNSSQARDSLLSSEAVRSAILTQTTALLSRLKRKCCHRREGMLPGGLLRSEYKGAV